MLARQYNELGNTFYLLCLSSMKGRLFFLDRCTMYINTSGILKILKPALLPALLTNCMTYVEQPLSLCTHTFLVTFFSTLHLFVIVDL